MRRGLAVRSTKNVVNNFYKPFPSKPLPLPKNYAPEYQIDNERLLEKHNPNDGKWDTKRICETVQEHTLAPWQPGKVPVKNITHAEGVYLYTGDGERVLDFNSQAMCTSLGHSIPQTILDGIMKQLKEIPMVYALDFTVEIRARLSALLADITPGDLNAFYFCSGGAEANEVAIKAARMYTGKHKILTRHRSYHGGTTATLQMTGDQRRHSVQSGNGMVQFFDPYPYTFSWGEDEEECCRRNLEYLREFIEYEGPGTIAAIHLESVTGTNGILIPPKGYLAGIRGLCDEYNILMMCDEVMAGFGRTGKWFGFMHSDPEVIPDIFTSAKGMNSAILPLGVVATREKLREFFFHNSIATGSTYNSHPVALASAYHTLRYMLEHDLVENVRRKEAVMINEMNALASKHPSVKQCRVIGLFGAIDLQGNTQGEPLGRYLDPMPKDLLAFKQALSEENIYTFVRPGGIIHSNPPFIITDEQIKEGFGKISRALSRTVDLTFQP